MTQRSRKLRGESRPGSLSFEIWFRRVALLFLLGIVAAGLANVFGQDSSVDLTTAPAASLEVDAPAAARSGVIYQAKLTVASRRELKRPTVALDEGWFDGLTINSVNPEPVEWSQTNGRNVLSFGRIPAGSMFVVRLEYQVNPTTFGRREQGVVLADRGVAVAAVSRALTIYP
jgi:hypothetical protein